MDPVPPGGPPDWVEQIAQLAKILSWVSCTTVLLPIATFLLFPSKRAFPARLPVHMCIAILGVCLTALFGLYFPVSFCPYQAIGIQFFGNAGILWWLIISFNFFQVFVLDRTEYRFEKPFVFIGWGIPLIVTIIAKATDQLDNSPMPYQWECWIGEFGGYAQWVYLYAFMGSSCLFGLFMWVRIIHRIWFTHVAPSSGQDRPLVLLGYVRHLIFLCAFLFVFSCLFAYRIANDILRGQTGFSLTLLHTICVCGTGVYCFVVFGLTSQNLDLWWSALRNVFYPGASKSEKYASGGSSAYGTFSTTPLASPSELDASEGSTVYKFSQGDGNPLEAPLLVTAGNASFTSDSNPLSDSDDDVYNPFAPTASSGQSQDRL